MSDVDVKSILGNSSVREFLKINNFIATRDLIFRVTVELFVAVSVYYLFEGGQYIVGAAAFYLLAIWHSFWGYAGIGHELMHGRVFSSRRLNNVLYFFTSFLVWSNPAFFKSSHIFHHAHTFDPNDSESNGVQNWKLISIVVYLTLDLPLMVRKITYSILNSIGLKFTVKGGISKVDLKELVAARHLLLFQMFINVVIITVTGNLFYNLLWLLLPFTGQFVNRVLAQSQHIGLSKYCSDGPLVHSRSVRLPNALTFMYAGMNYHAEHHLLPSIPYYKLPQFSSFLISTTSHKLDDWVPFFTKDFWQLVSEIKK
jgi:fatty acid desaturase